MALVLLVDDERYVREVTHRLLLRSGHEVLVAGSPEEALGVFATCQRPVELLLTDVSMPGMSGRELGERIRQLEPDIPIVYMSGAAAGHIAPGRGLPPGSSFLAKPFQPQALAAALQKALRA